MTETLGILFLTIVAPIWIISHYVSKHKQSKGLTPEDERMLAEVPPGKSITHQGPGER